MTMNIGWTVSEVTPGVMVSMCVCSVGICLEGEREGNVWREGEKIGRVGNDVMLFNVLVGEDSR